MKVHHWIEAVIERWMADHAWDPICLGEIKRFYRMIRASQSESNAHLYTRLYLLERKTFLYQQALEDIWGKGYDYDGHLYPDGWLDHKGILTLVDEMVEIADEARSGRTWYTDVGEVTD